MNNRKQKLFNQLCADVVHCERCTEMVQRSPVLSELNGNIESSILFVAEAPGRLGADKFRIPLYGDATGKHFESFLAMADLCRADVFITNAVLCNPRTPAGNNRTPSRIEVHQCLAHLAALVDLMHPRLIVSLGATALNSLNLLFNSEVSLRHQCATKVNIGSTITLFPLYHTSPLAFVHRPKPLQIQDYKKLRTIIHDSP